MKQPITFTAAGHTFRGYEHRVSNEVLVFFHGFTGHMAESGRLFYHLSNDLVTKGISTIRFDWFGHGESDLDFVDARVDLLTEEAQEILRYAHEQYDTVYLLGFSMGGAFAMNQASKDIEKLILLAPAYRIAGMKHHYFDNNPEVTKDLGGMVLHKEFTQGFQTLDMVENVIQYSNPVLLIQGELDQSVPKENAIELDKQLKHSQLEIIPDADHCFHNREQHRFISSLITTFLHPKNGN